MSAHAKRQGDRRDTARTRDFPVATWDDDGSTSIIGAQQFAKQNKADIGSPYDGTEKLIAEFKRRGKVKDVDLARELAISIASSEFLEKSEIGLHPEIAKIIGSKLVSKIQWGRLWSTATKDKKKARAQHELWQSKYDEILSRKPKTTKATAAVWIAADVGGDPDWIRRVIVKRK